MKINIRVKPNAKTNEVSKDGDKMTVFVKKPPTEGRANEELIKILAEHFNVKKSQIRIRAGLKSKNKIIEII